MAEGSPKLPANAAFMQRHVQPRKGRTLIVGSKVYEAREDRRAAYSDVVGVDMLPGAGVDLCVDLCAKDVDVVRELGGMFVHVECWSVLEHAKRPWVLAENLQRLLVPGGTLHLTVPFVWRVHDYPQDFWRFTLDGVRELFPRIRWAALMYGDDRLHSNRRSRACRSAEFAVPVFARTEVFGFGVLG